MRYIVIAFAVWLMLLREWARVKYNTCTDYSWIKDATEREIEKRETEEGEEGRRYAYIQAS